MRTAAQTAFLMAILTLLSKLFGFVREMVMANYFGTSYITDSYVLATSVPIILFGSLISAVAIAFMPLLSDKVEKVNDKEASLFTSNVINMLLCLAIVASLVGIFFSDQVVAVFASGFKGKTAELTSYFIKVTFSYLIFSSSATILESYLQYKNIFLLQIIVGYTQNIILIIGIILSALYNHNILPFGLLTAYCLRLLIFKTLASKHGMDYYFSLKCKDTFKLIMPLAIPTLIGSSISSLGMFVDRSLASGLKTGSVAALNYANLLNGLIMALSITILTTIIYPRLNKANSLKDYDRFSEIIRKGFVLVFAIALPFTLGAMLYSNQIVQIVYERGAFDIKATSLTQSAYFYYSIGLLFFAVNDLLVRGYYSLRDMKLPMYIGMFSVVIDIILNFALIRPMAHNGLALSTSIGSVLNTVLLVYFMEKKYPFIKLIQTRSKIVKISIAAIVSVTVSYIFYLSIMTYFNQIIYIRIVQLGLAVFAAVIVYYVMLKVLKIEEIDMIKQVFRRNYEE